MKKTENAKKLYPVTRAQIELLTEDAFKSKDSVTVNQLGFCVFVKENFDRFAMEKALLRIVSENDALKLKVIKEWPLLRFRQYFDDDFSSDIEYKKFADENEVKEFVNTVKNTDFPMLSSHLWHAWVFDCEQGGGAIVKFHHACCDGYSLGMIIALTDKYYNEYRTGNITETKTTYSVTEYFNEEAKYSRSDMKKTDKKWWLKKYLSRKNYCVPVPRRSSDFKTDDCEMRITGESYNKFCDFCRRNRVSVASAMISFAALTVYKLSGKNSFCIYTLLHGRDTFKLKKTVGCFVKTLPVFFDIDKSLTVSEFLKSSYSDYLEFVLHSNIPFVYHIIDSIPLNIKTLDYMHGWLQFSNLDFESITNSLSFDSIDAIKPDTSSSQLYLGAYDNPEVGEMRVKLKYQLKVFTRDEITAYLQTYKSIVEAACDGEKTVADLFQNL